MNGEQEMPGGVHGGTGGGGEWGCAELREESESLSVMEREMGRGRPGDWNWDGGTGSILKPQLVCLLLSNFQSHKKTLNINS